MKAPTTITKNFAPEDLYRDSFEILFDNSPVSVFIHDSKTGEVVHANKAALQQHEISSPAEFKNSKTWLDAPYSFDDARKLIIKTAKEGTREFEWKFLNAHGEILWEQIKLVPIVIEGKKRVMATTINISKHKNNEIKFKRKNFKLDKALEEVNQAWSFQTMINCISNEFITANHSNIHDTLNHTIRLLGKFIKLERACITLFDNDNKDITNIYKWSTTGNCSLEDCLRSFELGDAVWYRKRIIHDKRIVHIPDTAMMDQEAAPEQKLFLTLGIKSVLSVPINSGNKVFGMMSFSSFTQNINWDAKQINAIMIITRIISSALHRIDTELDLIKANKELRTKKQSLEQLNANLENRISREIEKNREKEQLMALQSRHAAMGEMIANIAHQWRQPLNLINLICYDIYDGFKHGDITTEELSKAYTEINENVQFMSKTIDDFRNFFKPGRKRSQFAVFDFVEKAVSLSGSGFLNIKVANKCRKDISICGYYNELLQVAVNIMNNARDAMNSAKVEDKKITIGTDMADDHVAVFFNNTGEPIPDDTMEKIFDPYFSTKPQGEGTGLGLYMSKMIIEKNMGGRLYARNLPDGVSFIMELKREE